MLFLFTVFPRVNNVVYIQDELYRYRCEREGSLMNIAGRDLEWKVDMHICIVEMILTDWKENNYIGQVMDELYWWCLEFVLYDLENKNISKLHRKMVAIKYKELLEKYELHFVCNNKASKAMEKRLINLANDN